MKVRGTIHGSPEFLISMAGYLDEKPLLLEPAEHFDQAVVGLTEHARDQWTRNTPHPALIYDTKKCIEAIAQMCSENGKLDYEAATDYFYYNTAGAWVGPGTPTFRDPEAERDG